MLQNIRINTKLFVAIFLVAALGVALLDNLLIGVSGKVMREKAIREVQDNARFESQEMGMQMNIAMESVRGLIRIFSRYDNFAVAERRPILSNIVRNTLESNPNFLCVWAVFEPNVVDQLDKKFANKPGSTTEGRFCPSFFRSPDGAIEEESEVMDDAELGSSDYVSIPKLKKNETLLEPYFYSYSESGSDSVYETTIVIPIENDKGNMVGIAGIDFDLKKFQRYAANIKPYEGEGFAILMSNEGSIVYHPDTTLIGSNLEKLHLGSDSIAERIRRGESFQIETGSEGKKLFLFFNPLKIGKSDSPWSLALVVPEKRIMEPVNHVRSQVIWMSALILSVLIVVIFLVTFAFSRSLHKVTLQIGGATQEILEGNLNLVFDTAKVNIEFRPILEGLSEITGNFRLIVGRIRESSQTIHHTSKEFLNATEEMNKSVEGLTRVTDSFSAIMQEMLGRISQNSGNARETEKISLKASKSIALTNIKLKESQDAMHSIAGKVGVINDISFQTNILALNAAVEAARAGEHGRGFSVVAGEVKKLAERSRAASDEIQKLMSYAVEHSDSAMQRMDKLVPEIDRTSKLVQDIATKSTEQSEEATEAGQTLQHLTAEARGQKALLTSITQFSMQLENEALALEELISKYQLNTNEPVSNSAAGQNDADRPTGSEKDIYPENA